VLETCAWENGYIKRDVDKLIPSSPCGDRPPNSSLTDKTAEHKTEEDSGVEFDGVHAVRCQPRVGDSVGILRPM
jgi:hypothetical protein